MSWVPPEAPFNQPLVVPLEEPPRRSRSAMWVRVVGALVIFGLLVGLVSSLLFGNEDEISKENTTSKELKKTVIELSDFVETERSLKFRKPVEVTLLDDEAFVERLLEDAEEDRDDVEKMEKLLGILNLLEPNGKLFDELNNFLGEAVLGFYDPKTDELVVRGLKMSPFIRLTLVHELTHALDDQIFDLDRDAVMESDDESGLGFSTLVEGSALTVESAYRRSLSPSQRSQAIREEGQFGSDLTYGNIPEIISAFVSFPYQVGEDLITTILDDGGDKALAAAFEKPPTTSEQLLDPVLYVKGEGAIEVDPPSADGTQIDQGSFGELLLQFLLAGVLDSEEDESEATEGWGGDWYVAWEDGPDTCLRATFVMDTKRDLDELVAALKKWSKEKNSQVEPTQDSVTLTVCG
ncbi:MAG: hypothetical protein ACSLFB_12420 [Acidimicrobiales bacterium]